ncbi:MAG TPA: hypothetical protein VE263_00910 [Candidatus Angelobacter sp.]|nr:hypothetical protein [Candidatus Angelobacter sp.]
MIENQAVASASAPLTVSGRLLLFFFLLNGIAGVAGGLLVMKETLPFPRVWLQGTPFHTYLIPGLILCAVVGGSHLAAAFSILARRAWAKTACVLAGAILAGWMIGEILLIGFQAPIQVWFVGIGLLEFGLSLAKPSRA